MTAADEGDQTQPPGLPGSRKRPADRKLIIADVATHLFAERGFHNVRVEDIGRDVGITAGAVYRHYRDKQALLYALIEGRQDQLEHALQDAGARTPPMPVLDRLGELAYATLPGDLSLLWQREGRSLRPADRREARARAVAISQLFARVFADGLRTATPTEREIRSWACLSLLTARPPAKAGMSPTALSTLIARSCVVVLAGPVDARGDAGAAMRELPALGSRRDRVLRAAARTFVAYGFAEAKIDEIGAGAGVAGPAIYRYFETKHDLLVAALDRFHEWRALETARAMASSEDPRVVVRNLVHGYLRLAVEVPDLLGVAHSEWLHLPAGPRQRLERLHADELAVWTRCIRAARPGTSPAVGRLLVGCMWQMIDDVVLIPHLRRSPAIAPELGSAAVEVLLARE